MSKNPVRFRLLVNDDVVDIDEVACMLYGWHDGQRVDDKEKLNAAWIMDWYWNGERPRPECLRVRA